MGDFNAQVSADKRGYEKLWEKLERDHNIKKEKKSLDLCNGNQWVIENHGFKNENHIK